MCFLHERKLLLLSLLSPAKTFSLERAEERQSEMERKQEKEGKKEFPTFPLVGWWVCVCLFIFSVLSAQMNREMTKIQIN
jgi:hypothetical protein